MKLLAGSIRRSDRSYVANVELNLSEQELSLFSNCPNEEANRLAIDLIAEKAMLAAKGK